MFHSRHTGNFESFHNLILAYVPKRHAYQYVTHRSLRYLSYYFVGIKLSSTYTIAVLDNNAYCLRDQACNKAGAAIHVCKFRKQSKKWDITPAIDGAPAYHTIATMYGSNTTCQKSSVVLTHILFLQQTSSDGWGITLHLDGASPCICHIHTNVDHCWNLVVDQALLVLILPLPILAYKIIICSNN